MSIDFLSGKLSMSPQMQLGNSSTFVMPLEGAASQEEDPFSFVMPLEGEAPQEEDPFAFVMPLEGGAPQEEDSFSFVIPVDEASLQKDAEEVGIQKAFDDAFGKGKMSNRPMTAQPLQKRSSFFVSRCSSTAGMEEERSPTVLTKGFQALRDAEKHREQREQLAKVHKCTQEGQSQCPPEMSRATCLSKRVFTLEADNRKRSERARRESVKNALQIFMDRYFLSEKANLCLTELGCLLGVHGEETSEGILSLRQFSRGWVRDFLEESGRQGSPVYQELKDRFWAAARVQAIGDLEFHPTSSSGVESSVFRNEMKNMQQAVFKETLMMQQALQADLQTMNKAPALFKRRVSQMCGEELALQQVVFREEAALQQGARSEGAVMQKEVQVYLQTMKANPKVLEQCVEYLTQLVLERLQGAKRIDPDRLDSFKISLASVWKAELDKFYEKM